MSRVAVVGGGIVGLCTAYYLRKSGFEVTVYDSGDFRHGTSFGNAGMIVPSHVIPLASPGMISKGIRWMFNSSSPFYVKPRLSSGLIRWGFEFYKHANSAHVKRSIPALKELSILSKGLYTELAREVPFDFGFQQRGLLMLYQRPETGHEEMETARMANHAGIEAHLLSAEQIQKLEPDVLVTALGGVYYPGDAHLIPGVLMEKLQTRLISQGVKFRSGSTVTTFGFSQGFVNNVRVDNESIETDHVVIATGAWSSSVCASLGISLLMQAGKGYSFTLKQVEKNIRIPTIFLDHRVAVTPMGSDLRFGGTMEIAGVDQSINMKRVKGIVDSIPQYYPGMNVAMPSMDTVWHGLRPCSPDGLPYIGRVRHLRNVVIATGHAMMGVSLAPATGKIVSNLISGLEPGMNLAPFNPERFA